MITRTYQPEISEQEIQSILGLEARESLDVEQLDLKKEKRKYRLGILTKGILALILGGILFVGRTFPGKLISNFCLVAGGLLLFSAPFYLVFGLIRSFTSVSQKDPKKVMRSFIKELFGNDPDYARAYKVIVPATSKDVPVNMFSEKWKAVKEDALNSVKFQESITCEHCNQEFNGLWADGLWRLPDDKLKKNGLLLRCENCQAVYCSTCYLGFERSGGIIKKRYCPNCDSKMEDEGLEIFQSKPDVSGGFAGIDELTVDYDQEERAAHLKAKVKFVYRLKKIVLPTGIMDDNYSDLGDKGTVVCNFSNTAVKIGENWYLVAALPEQN